MVSRREIFGRRGQEIRFGNRMYSVYRVRRDSLTAVSCTSEGFEPMEPFGETLEQEQEPGLSRQYGKQKKARSWLGNRAFDKQNRTWYHRILKGAEIEDLFRRDHRG